MPAVTEGDERRVVVVTGASSGIGLATAVAFAQGGHHVVAAVRASSRRDGLVAAVDAAGVTVDVVDLDVTDESAIRANAAAITDRHGVVDVVINCAGLGYVGTLEELSIDDFRTSMEVNFFGVAGVTKAFLPAMRGAGRGHLVAVTSLGGVLGQPFNDAYCAAKFAVEGLYESLHPVAARFGVHVSIVEPGPVATEFRAHSKAAEAPANPELAVLKARYAAVTNAGFERAQSAQDVAAVIVGVTRDDPPRLRYQTSKFTSRLVGRKLSDLTGEQVAAFTGAWLADPADP